MSLLTILNAPFRFFEKLLDSSEMEFQAVALENRVKELLGTNDQFEAEVAELQDELARTESAFETLANNSSAERIKLNAALDGERLKSAALANDVVSLRKHVDELVARVNAEFDVNVGLKEDKRMLLNKTGMLTEVCDSLVRQLAKPKTPAKKKKKQT